MMYLKKAVARRHKCGGSKFFAIIESSNGVFMQLFEL